MTESHPYNNTNFYGATFSGGANFRVAVFSGDANFNQVTFSEGANFDGVTFSGSVNFVGATFSGRTLFSRLPGNAQAGRIFAGTTVDFRQVVINPPDAITFIGADFTTCQFLDTDLRKAQLVDALFQQLLTRRTKRALLSELAGGHLRIRASA